MTNLTATSRGYVQGGRSTVAKSSGKYYYEISLDSVTNSDNVFGLISPSGGLTQCAAGGGTDGVACFLNGNVQADWVAGEGFITVQTGDLLGVAVDVDHKKIWIRVVSGPSASFSTDWDGESITNSDPANNIGGNLFNVGTVEPFFAFESDTLTDSATMNFGATAFGGAPPAGYTAGWPSGAGFATFDPAASVKVTLSNSNLTVTNAGLQGDVEGVKIPLAAGMTFGKWYFEITASVVGDIDTGSSNAFGVGTVGSTYDDLINNYGVNGAVCYGGSLYSSGTYFNRLVNQFYSGDVCGVAVDLDNHQIWFKPLNGVGASERIPWNNSSTADPSTTIGGMGIPPGTMVPFVGFQYADSGDQWIGNFGTQDFVGEVPDNFGIGWNCNGLGGGGPVCECAIFDQSTTNSIDLSNGHLTATDHVGVNTLVQGVRGSLARASGRWYFEVAVTIPGPTPARTFFSMGIAFDGYHYNDWARTGDPASYGVGVFANGGIYSNGYNTFGALNKSLVTGDIVGIAVDLDNRYAWFSIVAGSGADGRWNGGSTYNSDIISDPATGSSGIYIRLPFVTDTAARDHNIDAYRPVLVFGDANNGQVMTANFGGTAFAGTIPTGYQAWGSTSTLDPVTAFRVTLSNGNLTATNTGEIDAVASVHVTTNDPNSKTYGKHYFEMTLVTSLDSDNGFGVAQTDLVYPADDYTGSTRFALNGRYGVICLQNGEIWANGVDTGYNVGTITQGMTVGVAVDLDYYLAWFKPVGSSYWNNNPSANPVTATGGIPIPGYLDIMDTFSDIEPIVVMGGWLRDTSGNVFTANFGCSPFLGTQPTGFEGWDCLPYSDPPVLWPEKASNYIANVAGGRIWAAYGYDCSYTSAAAPERRTYNHLDFSAVDPNGLDWGASDDPALILADANYVYYISGSGFPITRIPLNGTFNDRQTLTDPTLIWPNTYLSGVGNYTAQIFNGKLYIGWTGVWQTVHQSMKLVIVDLSNFTVSGVTAYDYSTDTTNIPTCYSLNIGTNGVIMIMTQPSGLTGPCNLYFSNVTTPSIWTSTSITYQCGIGVTDGNNAYFMEYAGIGSTKHRTHLTKVDVSSGSPSITYIDCSADDPNFRFHDQGQIMWKSSTTLFLSCNWTTQNTSYDHRSTDNQYIQMRALGSLTLTGGNVIANLLYNWQLELVIEGVPVYDPVTAKHWIVLFAQEYDGRMMTVDHNLTTATLWPHPLSSVPSNDNYANAIPISHGQRNIGTNLYLASTDANEPRPPSFASIGSPYWSWFETHSVWYQFTAPATGTFVASAIQFVNQTADTWNVLVYSGVILATATEVGAHAGDGNVHEYGGPLGAAFAATNGASYNIGVTTWSPSYYPDPEMNCYHAVTTFGPYGAFDSGSAANVTLSGGNWSAINTGTTSTNQGAHVQAAAGKSYGLYYFQVRWDDIGTHGSGDTNYGCGVGRIEATFAGMGTNGLGGAMLMKNGNIYVNGTLAATISQAYVGDIIEWCIDCIDWKIWVRNWSNNDPWNGNSSADPTISSSTPTGGLSIPPGTYVPFVTFGGVTDGTTGRKQTLNLSQLNFTYLEPPAVNSLTTFGWTIGWPLTLGDPSWGNVTLMVGGDDKYVIGSGETVPWDESWVGGNSWPSTWTLAIVSTDQAKAGTHSLKFNSTGAMQWGAALGNFGINHFTAEAFIYPTSVTGSQTIMGNWGGAGSRSWRLWLNGTTLNFSDSTDGTTENVDLTGGTIGTGSWQHIAVDYDGIKYRLYVNGTTVATSTTARALFASTGSFQLGLQGGGGYNGYMDEVRITKGTARYRTDTSFTVPTVPFPRYQF